MLLDTLAEPTQLTDILIHIQFSKPFHALVLITSNKVLSVGIIEYSHMSAHAYNAAAHSVIISIRFYELQTIDKYFLPTPVPHFLFSFGSLLFTVVVVVVRKCYSIQWYNQVSKQLPEMRKKEIKSIKKIMSKTKNCKKES
uniref:Uncharacterized protein n=1 Tax=Glossina pallidipes TaxID=7398 RepID=A0A1A9ZH15_GLOPL